MEDTETVESAIKKISMEIDSVRNHVLEAKNSLRYDSKDQALSHLREARKVSTCSYCQKKIDELVFDIEYNRNICSIDSKNCEPNKEIIIQKMDEFYGKLPSVEEIRRNKAVGLNFNIDPLSEVFKSFDEMVKSFGRLLEGLTKW